MRSKFGPERRDEWRCAFCCHVRTGTILLGIWYLILHILALAVIAVELIHPELIEKPHRNPASDEALLSVEPQKVKVFEYHYEYSFFKDCKWSTHNINAGMVVTFCTFLITVLMVYGAVKGKPRYLMPFFCLQIFDFCIASLTVISFFSYTPDVRQSIVDNPNIPFQNELHKLDTQWLSLIILIITFVFLMMVKAYFIGVVWSCYKFLVYRNAHCGAMEYIDADTSALLPPPPDYETVSKDVKQLPIYNATPPPPYTPPEETI